MELILDEHKPSLLWRAIFEIEPSLVSTAVADGEDPNIIPAGFSWSWLQLAVFHRRYEAIVELIKYGVVVQEDSLSPLGEMDITDYMIESIYEEAEYAKIITLLGNLGAKVNIKAYNGVELIENFPEQDYPLIYRAILAVTRHTISEFLAHYLRKV